MSQTDDIVHWPVVRCAGEKFLPKVKRFHVYNEGRSALLATQDLAYYAIGDNSYGCLGLGHCNQVTEPTEVVELKGKKVVMCDSGSGHVMVVTSDGQLIAWGRNDEGQVGCDNEQDQHRPVLVMSDVTMIACGVWHSAALDKNGTVWCWGNNSNGQLGLGHCDKQCKPTNVTQLESQRVLLIDCGTFSCVVLTDQAQVYQWGWFGNQLEFPTPTLVTVSSDLSIASITCGYDDFILLSTDGQAHRCYYEDNGFKLQSIELDEPVHSVVWAKAWSSNPYCVKLRSNNVIVWNSSGQMTRTTLTSMPDVCALYCNAAVTPGLTTLPQHAIRVQIMQSITYLNNLTTANFTLNVQMKPIYINKGLASKLSCYLAAQFNGPWKAKNEVEIDGYQYVVYFTWLYYVFTDAIPIIEPDWSMQLLTLTIETNTAQLRDICLQMMTFDDDHLRKVAKDCEQQRYLSCYLIATLSEAKCYFYYELATEAKDEGLQEKIVKFVVKLGDKGHQFIEDNFDQLKQNACQWAHISKYLADGLNQTNYGQHYELAVKGEDEVLQELIVRFIVTLQDKCLHFIADNFDKLHQKASQWVHIAEYLANGLKPTNCGHHYELAVNAKDEGLQKQIVHFVQKLDLKSQFALYVTKGYGGCQGKHIKTLFRQVYTFPIGHREQTDDNDFDRDSSESDSNDFDRDSSESDSNDFDRDSSESDSNDFDRD